MDTVVHSQRRCRPSRCAADRAAAAPQSGGHRQRDKPFYGATAGDRLTALLKDHILIAAELVAAAKAGDGPKVDAARARWYANADEIASFLATANPRSWPQAHMRAMMREHLDLALEEATARVHGDWVADIAAYEKIRQRALSMADMLSGGIIDRFPKAFR